MISASASTATLGRLLAGPAVALVVSLIGLTMNPAPIVLATLAALFLVPRFLIG